MARKPCGWHPERIKMELRKRFGTLRAFAKLHGYSAAAISNAISVAGYSVPLQEIIAEATGETASALWPDRYHDDGSPVSFRADRTPTVLNFQTHRQNGVAA